MPRYQRSPGRPAWTQHIAAGTASTARHGSSVSTGPVVAGCILAILTPVIRVIPGVV